MKIISSILLLFFLETKAFNAKEVNGNYDITKEYSFVVVVNVIDGNIGNSENSRCLGSFVTDEWVLTAAHCIVPGLLTVTSYGNDEITKTPTAINMKVLQKFYHPSFSKNFKMVKNDIALLKTEKIKRRKYGQILSKDYRSLIGFGVKYAGHKLATEATQLQGIDYLGHMEIGQGVLMPCEEIRKSLMFITAMCIIPSSKKVYVTDIGGESGAPLMVAGKIAGIVHGYRKDGLKYLSFTPISPNLDWISHVIHGKTVKNTISTQNIRRVKRAPKFETISVSVAAFESVFTKKPKNNTKVEIKTVFSSDLDKTESNEKEIEELSTKLPYTIKVHHVETVTYAPVSRIQKKIRTTATAKTLWRVWKQVRETEESSQEEQTFPSRTTFRHTTATRRFKTPTPSRPKRTTKPKELLQKSTETKSKDNSKPIPLASFEKFHINKPNYLIHNNKLENSKLQKTQKFGRKAVGKDLDFFFKKNIKWSS